MEEIMKGFHQEMKSFIEYYFISSVDYEHNPMQRFGEEVIHFM